MKVWVIAIATMKIAKVIGWIVVKRYADKDIKNIEIRFMWMPGIRPVIVPEAIPSKRAIKISSNILSPCSFYRR